MDGAFNDLALALAPGADPCRGDLAALDRLLAPTAASAPTARGSDLPQLPRRRDRASSQRRRASFPAIFLGVAAFLLHIVLSRLVPRSATRSPLLKAFGYGNAAVGLHYLAVRPGDGRSSGRSLGYGGRHSGSGAGHDAHVRRLLPLPGAPVRCRTPASWRSRSLGGVGAALLGALGAVRRACPCRRPRRCAREAPARFRAGCSSGWRCARRPLPRGAHDRRATRAAPDPVRAVRPRHRAGGRRSSFWAATSST